jgi:hypothetical protein
MNGSGKDCITSLLATKIMQIFTTNKLKPLIFLTWKADTKEEDREEGSEEGGKNNPSQESGLNEKLTRNNNICSVINVSDSVTSEGGKESESESEGDSLKHTASKRTKMNTRSRYDDFFYGHTTKWYWDERGTGQLTNTCSPKYGLQSVTRSENKKKLTNCNKYISPTYQGH